MARMSFDGRLSGGTFASGKNASSARAFRRDGGFMFVVGQLRIQEFLIRGANGRFLPEVQHRFANANRVLAEQLQEEIAERLEDVRVQSRRGVSSGRLREAILSPKNVVAAPGGMQFGFGVMNTEWLDQSQAKYWRSIEVGTHHFVGKEIRGVWGGSLTGEYGGQSPFGPYPIAGPPFTMFGANKAGRLYPGGASKGTDARREARRSAYARMRAGGATAKGARDARNGGTKGIIQRPIQPERYAIGAWEEFGMKAKIEKAFTDAFYGSIPSRAAIEFDYGLRDTPPRGRGSTFRGSLT